MMKELLFPIAVLTFTISLQAQRKSELFAQIETLKSEKDTLTQALAQAKRSISASEAKAETFEMENTSLRDANATLLKNLTSFSELSKKNTENVNKTPLALQQKEQQLSGINQTISSNDSTAIVMRGRVQQTLGDKGNADFSDGAIVMGNSLNTLFGDDTSTTLTEKGAEWLETLSGIITTYRDRQVEVVGLNITGEFGPTFDKAHVIIKSLSETYSISAERLSLSVQDGNFKEGILVKMVPDYKKFYDMVKDSVKAAQ